MKYTESKTTTKYLEKGLGYLMLFIGVGKFFNMNTSNFFTISFDIIMIFIVWGFAFSFMKKE